MTTYKESKFLSHYKCFIKRTTLTEMSCFVKEILFQGRWSNMHIHISANNSTNYTKLKTKHMKYTENNWQKMYILVFNLLAASTQLMRPIPPSLLPRLTNYLITANFKLGSQRTLFYASRRSFPPYSRRPESLTMCQM